MKRTLALIFCLALTLSFSCKKKQQDTKPGAGAGQAAANPSPARNFQGNAAGPELYYKCRLDQLRMEHEMNIKFFNLLKAAKKYDAELEAKIAELEIESAVQFKELKHRYEFSPMAPVKSGWSPESKTALKNFLAQHPDIKKEVEELEKTNQQLGEDMNMELRRLEAASKPPERTPPAEGTGKPQ